MCLSVNVSHVTRVFLNLCYYVIWMPSMPEQVPKRVSALIGKWLPALVFYIFLLLRQTLWHHKNLSKFLPINFLIISFNIKSCLSCQFSIYSWICVYFLTCFRRIGEFYQRLLSKHNILQAGVFQFRKWTQRRKFCKYNTDAFCRGQGWTRWYQETWEKLL